MDVARSVGTPLATSSYRPMTPAEVYIPTGDFMSPSLASTTTVTSSWANEFRPATGCGKLSYITPSIRHGTAGFPTSSSGSPVFYDQVAPQTAPASMTTQTGHQRVYMGEPPEDAFAFAPPPLDYQFPAPLGQFASSLQASPSNMSEGSYSPFSQSDPASPAEGATRASAWWPFRDVKVIRDEAHGIPLQAFLEEMAEHEGEQRASYAHGNGCYSLSKAETPRPNTAYSMLSDTESYHPTPLLMQI